MRSVWNSPYNKTELSFIVMQSRIVAAVLAAALLGVPLAAGAQTTQSGSATLSGRVLDTSGGLPVQGADVELDAGGQKVATTTTDANGVYSFKAEPQGEYSVLIVARGYVATRVPTVFLIDGRLTNITTAVQPSSNGSTNLKEIGRVVTGLNSGNSLQTTTTVNEYVDPSQVQSLAYSHVGDLLARLPGIDMHTSPSVGDDMSISIRGFDPSETATLLDGHPVGPIGAFGGANSPGFDYKLAPFWGLSGTNVIMGSGAAGLYGVSTIAGAVNFQTLNPTRTPEASLFQGIGNLDHTMSAASATGSLGKFGYALAGAVQGSTGQFPGGDITQTANMANSAVCGNCSGGTGTYPDISSANAAANTYFVSGAYTQRSDLVKFTYAPSSKTQLLTSYYDGSTWNDKTGNGDQDAISSPLALQNAQGQVGQNFSFGNVTTNCSNTTIPILDNSSAGYGCYTPQQYAQFFSGPAGGGIGRWNASHMQDYHARVTQQFGSTQFIVDGFVNNYNMDEHKSPTGPFYEDNYLTHGLLLSDEFQLGNHDISLGYYTQHQRHAYSTNYSGGKASVVNPAFFLGSNSYFLRDQWQASLKFAVSADLWEQYSVATHTYNFDPRLAFVFRPDSNDVIRLTGGRSYSEPDPSLLYVAPQPSLAAAPSVNPVYGGFTGIGSAGDPYLKPETAIDEEIGYGHRFNRRLSFQVDAYNTIENNAILSSTLPLSAYPQYGSFFTAAVLQPYLARLSPLIPGITASGLGLTAYANAAQAVYRGIDLEANVGVLRNLTLDAQYGTQVAQYRGIPDALLQTNPYLVNNEQFAKIPLQKAFASLVYANASGVKAEVDETYVGNNNQFVTPAFAYTDASIAKTTDNITVTFGVANVFNNAALQYGEIGLGTPVPVNSYGMANGLTTGLAQGQELYGMVPRQAWLTVTFHL